LSDVIDAHDFTSLTLWRGDPEEQS
jgi:hypothetical protein